MSVRVEKMRERRRKIRNVLILFCLAAALLLFLKFGCRLVHLEIKGCTYYGDEALRSWLCGNEWENNTIYLYLKLRFGEKPSIPFIEQLEVDFVNLSTLRVGVYEKEIIGYLPYMGEYVCFDKDGVMVGSVTEKKETIPEVTGIKYEKIIYNEAVDTPHSELFTVILNVTQLIHKFELPVSRIAFNHQQEITLYAEDVRMLMGKHDQYDEAISALPGILKEAKGFKGTLNMKDYALKNQTVIFVKDDT